MKSFKNNCILLLLTLITVFCITACNPSTNGGDKQGGDDGKDSGDAVVVYEVTVNTENVTVDTSDIKVCIFALDGSEGSIEAELTNGRATFALNADNYIATLRGLDETVSFSSVLLTKTDRKATIALDYSTYKDVADTYNFAFTVILFSGERKLDEISAQMCDDSMCRPISFEQGNAADVQLSIGEYSVEVFDNDANELYNEKCTVTQDIRFCVIQL